jgi:hypothetical protein
MRCFTASASNLARHQRLPNWRSLASATAPPLAPIHRLTPPSSAAASHGRGRRRTWPSSPTGMQCSCTGTISGRSGGRPRPAATPSHNGAILSSEKAKIQPTSSLRVIQMMRPGMDLSPSTTICTQSYMLCKIFSSFRVQFS